MLEQNHAADLDQESILYCVDLSLFFQGCVP